MFPDSLKQRRGDSEGFLLRTLESVPDVAERMRGAERVAPVHVTGNYAYDCTRMHGRHWSLVGDAYSFVDPMFSSGVFLAMHSAEQAADMVDAALREPARERALQRDLQRRLDAGLDEFKWFIYRFTSPAMTPPVRQPAQRVAGRGSGGVDARRRRVRRAPGAAAPARVPRDLRADRARHGPARGAHGAGRRRQLSVEVRGETLQRED